VLIVPTVELPPTMPFTFQMTDVFAVFVTVAVNCLVRFTRTVALVGAIVMVTADSSRIVTDALPLDVGEAVLVARTVTVDGSGTVNGAMYSPLLSIMPTAELPPAMSFTLQVTLLGPPVTVAANVCA
jgi:hypothetical protein